MSSDIEVFRFNTAIARLMELTTALSRARESGGVDAATWERSVETLILLAAPLAPHIAEELWDRRGKPYSVHQQAWPEFDESLVVEETVEIVVQVNGRVRDHLTLPVDAGEEAALAGALASDRVQGWVEGKEPRRVIYVPGKLLNIVV